MHMRVKENAIFDSFYSDRGVAILGLSMTAHDAVDEQTRAAMQSLIRESVRQLNAQLKPHQTGKHRMGLALLLAANFLM